VASQNVEIAKKGYEAFGAGDVETALADFDDNIEWTIPGNSTLSGTYRGKEQSHGNAREGGGEVLHNNPRAVRRRRR
jgi:ketosteroid isomerase-like protein